MKNFEDKREKYLKAELIESLASENPINLFQTWMVDAINQHNLEPNSMIISTVDAFGQPDARTVLLKEIIDDSFVFYTNYESKKAKEIELNPKVSLLFLWLQSERQVRISGTAIKIDADKSTEYFQKRPRGSQIGAWTSPQSAVIPDRAYLDDRKQEMEDRFVGQPVLDRPDFWGGYMVIPHKIEFWQGRDNRLHDRLVYNRLEEGEKWNILRLAP